MKFINLPEGLCFSMETVHKVPLPPTEKYQEGPALSHTRPAPSSTLFPGSGCYGQVWGVDLVSSEGLRIPCFLCFSNQPLLLLACCVSPQDGHSEVFRWFDWWQLHTQVCGTQMPRRVPNHKPSAVSGSLAIHTPWNLCHLCPSVSLTTFPLGASHICCTFYQALAHRVCSSSSKVIWICLFYSWGNWGPEGLRFIFMVLGISPDCSAPSAQAPFRQCCDPSVRDGVVSPKGHSQIWVTLALGKQVALAWPGSNSELTTERRKGIVCFLSSI